MDLIQNKYQRLSTKRKYVQKDDKQSQYTPKCQKVREKKLRKQMKYTQSKQNQIYNYSTWSLQENLLYMLFLKNNSDLFQLQKQQRRAIKINVLISNYVKTRTADQCRSHHQKMLIYHGNIKAIAAYIQSLQNKKSESKVGQPIIYMQNETVSTPNSEMREIDQVVNNGSPTLWDSMVQDVWINI